VPHSKARGGESHWLRAIVRGDVASENPIQLVAVGDVVVFGGRHLRHLLNSYQKYYAKPLRGGKSRKMKRPKVDDPFLPDIFVEPGLDEKQKKRRAELYVEAANATLKGIPAERVRFHTSRPPRSIPRWCGKSSRPCGRMLISPPGDFGIESSKWRHDIGLRGEK
jgi:hypothetical protein